MATDDVPAPDERAGAGVSQKPWGMLPAFPLRLTPAACGHNIS